MGGEAYIRVGLSSQKRAERPPYLSEQAGAGGGNFRTRKRTTPSFALFPLKSAPLAEGDICGAEQ